MAMQNGIEVEQAQSIIYGVVTALADEMGENFHAELNDHVPSLSMMVGTCSTTEEMQERLENSIIELASQVTETVVLLAQRIAAQVADELGQLIVS